MEKFYLSRFNSLKRQNRLAETAKDFWLVKKISPRDPQAKSEQFDSTLYYNASLADKGYAGAPTNLDPLPRGIQCWLELSLT